MPATASRRNLGKGRKRRTAPAALVPDEPPEAKLQALEPLFTDPAEIERIMNQTRRSSLKEASLSAAACSYMKYGSTLSTWDKLRYSGPKSPLRTVFNIGSYKTGSTSAEAAARQLGISSCKIGWGEAGGNKDVAFSALSTCAFEQCPVWDDRNPKCGHNIDVIRHAPTICKMLGDAPWPFAWPITMRAYPYAKIILTRQKTCADWVYHVRPPYENTLP